ncbi:hypothetical protein DMC14_000975 [Metamycoplasma phocicerebrale]|uniref:Lipoprotein n=1 Tax=Metamycoplasma phocicerebrale TaxID=142649 RepID=A0A3T0TTS3_9BACT|nr:hypothetical protein [Metamycoplasma phocicerebrale]AZZ65366.1 hypothetical protein DMC14_000975 [Metamycoplasma phocicerebrale]
MKKTKKIWISSLGLLTTVALPLAAISCTKPEQKRYENLVKKLEDKIQNSKLPKDQKEIIAKGFSAIKKEISESKNITEEDYKRAADALEKILKSAEEILDKLK